jgi:predicted alpha/beta hydrolase family esterase
MGNSMGAWLGGLACCHNDRISAAALVTPVSRLDRAVRELSFCEPLRRALQGKAMDMARLNLASHKPKMSRGFMLLVEAEHDLFSPPETTEELWQAWGNPELWHQAEGHISILASSKITKRTMKWIGLRLKLPSGETEVIPRDRVLV